MTSLPEHRLDATQFYQFLANEPLTVLDPNVFPNIEQKENQQKKKLQDLSLEFFGKIGVQCGRSNAANVMPHKS